MLRLPFLAITMVMVASRGHVSGEGKEEELLKSRVIPMLADFDTKILSRLKSSCQKHVGNSEKMNKILCETVNELDKNVNAFGKNIVQQMNIGKPVTNEKEHSVSKLQQLAI
jgi:hypothetical protein